MKKTFVALAGILLLFSYAVAEDIVLSVDTNSTYKPTTIVNGNFDECPWQGFVYGGQTYEVAELKANAQNVQNNSTSNSTINNTTGDVSGKLWNGVDGGWNTTEITLFPYGKLYDWTKKVSKSFTKYAVQATYVSTFDSLTDFSFIEMNGYHPCVFYQDLTTHGKDVIRWTLKHARRVNSEEERIAVQIGAPETDSTGNLVPATASTGSDPLNPKIKKDGWAKFNYNGVTNNDSEHPYGFGNTSDLRYLTITTSDALGTWLPASGVYVVPEKQNVTRFAFISELPSASSKNSANGNLLDSITFSTLIGNLNAYADWDASVVISGYWGETDTSKQLWVELVDETGKNLGTEKIAMSSVSGKNFKVVIPQSVVTSANSVKIYHQDYVDAAVTIKIERHYHGDELFGVWNYSDKLPTTGRYALGTDVVLSSNVTLTGNSDMVDYGGAKICLNGHKISGANVIVAAGENALTITSLPVYDDGKTGSIESQLEVTGGNFTLTGGNVSTFKVTNGTCTLGGNVDIKTLSLTAGKVLTVASGLTGSIYLDSSTLYNLGVDGSVITSGFGAAGLKLGDVINLPAGVTDSRLVKTKSGELKVKRHKASW